MSLYQGDYEVWSEGKLLYAGPNQSKAKETFVLAATTRGAGSARHRNGVSVELSRIGKRNRSEVLYRSDDMSDAQLERVYDAATKWKWGR